MILSSHLRLQEIWLLTKKRFKNQKSEKTLRFGTLSFCPGYWKVSWRPTSYPTAPGWHIIKGGIQKVWGDNVTAGNSTEKILFGKPKRTHLPKTSILSWPRKNSVATSSLKRIQEGIIPSMWGWQILVKHQTYFITTYLFHGVLVRSSRCHPQKIHPLSDGISGNPPFLLKIPQLNLRTSKSAVPEWYFGASFAMCLVGIYIPMSWYTRSKWSTQEQAIWDNVFKVDGNYSRDLCSWMMWKTITLGSQLSWSIYIVPCTLRHVPFHASFLTNLTFLFFFGCKVNRSSKSKRPKVPKRLWKLLHEIRCGSKGWNRDEIKLF